MVPSWVVPRRLSEAVAWPFIRRNPICGWQGTREFVAAGKTECSAMWITWPTREVGVGHLLRDSVRRDQAEVLSHWLFESARMRSRSRTVAMRSRCGADLGTKLSTPARSTSGSTISAVEEE